MRKGRQASARPARILVSAPNRAGELFLCRLRQSGLPHAAVVNNPYEKSRLESLGIGELIEVDTKDSSTWTAPDVTIENVFLFEDSMNLCCRYIQLCKAWKTGPIHVVTRSDCSRAVYRSLGVKHLKYTTRREIPELVNRMV